MGNLGLWRSAWRGFTKDISNMRSADHQDTHLHLLHFFFWLCLLIYREENEAYLAGLGTVGMEIYEQVSKLDAVVIPAAGQYGLLAATAAAIKHLNSRILVIVSTRSN